MDLLLIVRISRVVHLELRMNLRIREDVPAGDAVLIGAVAPRVAIGVRVPEEVVHLGNNRRM